MNQTRIERVLSAMAAEGLPQLIVTDPLSIRYLTGADIFPGERMLALLLREDGEHTFFVNILFRSQRADCRWYGFRTPTTARR